MPWWPPTGQQASATGPHRAPGAAKHGADTIRVPHTSSNSGVWTWLGQRRASGEPADPLSQPSSSPAENHYTHMDDSFNPELMGEALYAELDRESMQSGNPSYQNTAYSACGEVGWPTRTNTDMTDRPRTLPPTQPDKELQVFSSAPSSAYYSDLSVTTNSVAAGERTYEIVGLAAMNQNCCPLLEAEGSQGDSTQFDLNVISSSHPGNTSVGRRHHRLSAINESGSAATHLQPSDFV